MSVTLASIGSRWRARRLATMVPPTPPPTIRTCWGITMPPSSTLVGFPRDEAGVPLLRERSNKFVFGLLYPGRDVFGGTRVAGEHGQHTADRQRLHPPDKFHQWPGAEAAARINFFINHDVNQFWHGNRLLSSQVHKLGDLEGRPHTYQMNRVKRPSLARSTKVATPVTSVTIGSRSASFISKSSMVMLHA